MPVAIASSSRPASSRYTSKLCFADVAARQHVRLEVGAAPAAPGSGRRAARRTRRGRCGARSRAPTSCGSAVRSPASCTMPAGTPLACSASTAASRACGWCTTRRSWASISSRRAKRPATVASDGSWARSAIVQLTVSHSRRHSSSLRQVMATSSLVAAAVHLVRAPLAERIDVAGGMGLAPVGQVVEHGRPDQVRARLHLGDVDVLALAGAPPGLQRRQHRHHRRQAGGVVVEREAGADVEPVGRVGQVREPAQRVDGGGVGDHVRPRALVAGTAHADVHDVRVPRPHVVVVEAPAGQHAGREVLHQHVGLLDHRADDGDGLGPLHVQRHEALRAVPHVEVREVGRVHQRGPLGGLELQHVGAEVAQDAVGERAGQHPREVDDADAVEGLARRRRPVVALGRRAWPAGARCGPTRRPRRSTVGRARPAAAAAPTAACRGTGRTARAGARRRSPRRRGTTCGGRTAGSRPPGPPSAPRRRRCGGAGPRGTARPSPW